MPDIKSDVETDDEFHAIFDENDDVEDFLGFSKHEVQDESESENSDSDCDEGYSHIVQKQRRQINKKKEMLKSLMEGLDQSPVFVKMKTSTPKQLAQMQRKVDSPKQIVHPKYFREPPVTRQRSGSKKLHGPLKAHPYLTVKFTQKKKINSNKLPCHRRSINTQPHVILPVEDVTPAMLKDIAEHSVGKQYDTVSGTSCHQCRQKTLDTKSCCRSDKCVGVRGQFCGPCLQNRYGESVAEALLDPEWKCPVCRGFCNCSICRNRSGKCATGILIGLARQHGHTNVKSYLESLAIDRSDD